MAISDYPNGQAPLSELVWVEDMWLDPVDMAPRVRFIAEYIRSRGGTFSGNEGYRPLGAPADRYIRDASKTSTGGSNQWYQKGREDRGDTPSAATPGTSNHGRGRSIDTNASSVSLRDEALALVGMVRDIPSETWHATIVGPSLVDLSAYQTDYVKQEEVKSEEEIEEEEMKALVEVVYAPFKSGDKPWGGEKGIGQAEYNYYLVNRALHTYAWIVQGGQIADAQNTFGPAKNVDAAYFSGMKNVFSRDAEV